MLVHVYVMWIVEVPLLGRFECSDDISSPEENDMSNQSSNLKHVSTYFYKSNVEEYRSIRHEHSVGEGSSESW